MLLPPTPPDGIRDMELDEPPYIALTLGLKGETSYRSRLYMSLPTLLLGLEIIAPTS